MIHKSLIHSSYKYRYQGNLEMFKSHWLPCQKFNEVFFSFFSTFPSLKTLHLLQVIVMHQGIFIPCLDFSNGHILLKIDLIVQLHLLYPITFSFMCFVEVTFQFKSQLILQELKVYKIQVQQIYGSPFILRNILANTKLRSVLYPFMPLFPFMCTHQAHLQTVRSLFGMTETVVRSHVHLWWFIDV